MTTLAHASRHQVARWTCPACGTAVSRFCGVIIFESDGSVWHGTCRPEYQDDKDVRELNKAEAKQ